MSTRRQRERRRRLQQQAAEQARVAEQEAAEAARAARREFWRARRVIVNRYGKQRKDGCGVIVCTPSRAELAGLIPMRAKGSVGKVAFPDRASAEAAARELEAIGCAPFYAYPCARSDSGHHHLTHDYARAREVRRGRRPVGAWQEAA